MFTPSRLALARKRRGLTKKFLAERAHLSDRILLAYEKGDAVPSPETLTVLSEVLDFPAEFFLGSEVATVSPGASSFRAISNLTAARRDSALAAGELSTLIEGWISKRFNLPKQAIPDLRGYAPEAAAEALRNEWGLGQGPIKNMIHLLESKGVRVFSLPAQDRVVDAFCFWSGNPFVLLNTATSGERSRFDAAHELGHLVLHRHGESQGRKAELEADQFASAFLMPRASILSEAPRFVTVDSYIKLKKLWKVSVAALNHRMHSVGIVSDWLYRNFCIEISKLGYRTSEPEGVEHEVSRVFTMVFQEMRNEGVTARQIASDLLITTSELSSLVFGQIFAPVNGGGESCPGPAKKASLHLVTCS